jgi:hypothetical protein
LTRTIKKKLKLSLKETIFPLFFSSRYKDIFQKISEYIKTKLSLDNILRESDEFDRVKKYLFNSYELYVFENIDKVNHRIPNIGLKEQFDYEKFKQYHQQILENQKFMEIIES